MAPAWDLIGPPAVAQAQEPETRILQLVEGMFRKPLSARLPENRLDFSFSNLLLLLFCVNLDATAFW